MKQFPWALLPVLAVSFYFLIRGIVRHARVKRTIRTIRQRGAIKYVYDVQQDKYVRQD